MKQYEPRSPGPPRLKFFSSQGHLPQAWTVTHVTEKPMKGDVTHVDSAEMYSYTRILV